MFGGHDPMEDTEFVRDLHTGETVPTQVPGGHFQDYQTVGDFDGNGAAAPGQPQQGMGAVTDPAQVAEYLKKYGGTVPEGAEQPAATPGVDWGKNIASLIAKAGTAYQYHQAGERVEQAQKGMPQYQYQPQYPGTLPRMVMFAKNNKVLILLSVVGLVAVGVGVWWLIKKKRQA